jgi:colicin import membrane protein
MTDRGDRMSKHSQGTAPDAGADAARRTAFTGNTAAEHVPARGLDGLLGTGPVFPHALRGYDCVQVDDYVAAAETELLVLRRENDHLLSRYAACSGELQNARRRLAQLVRERESLPSPEDARALLQRAEEEAEQVRAEARAEAEARLAKVAEMRQAVTALREQARREADARRAEAAAELQAVHREAEEARRAAAAQAQRERAAVEAELAALRAEKEGVCETLRVLTGHVDDALAGLARVLRDDEVGPDAAGTDALRTDTVRTGALPDDVSVLADRRDAAARDEGPRTSDGDPADVTALRGDADRGGNRNEVAAAS